MSLRMTANEWQMLGKIFMSNLTNTAAIKNDPATATFDGECPEISDEQFNIMRLVLSHKGVRGNSKVSLYYQDHLLLFGQP